MSPRADMSDEELSGWAELYDEELIKKRIRKAYLEYID
jgi:hypothetical protein